MNDKDRAQLLFANDAFYLTFAEGDFATMDRLWAERFPVSCIHPGWEPLFGREAVMNSWESILENPPQAKASNPEAFVCGDLGYVVCFEQVSEGHFLLATNIFTREAGEWKLTHHQAGMTRARPLEDLRERAEKVN